MGPNADTWQPVKEKIPAGTPCSFHCWHQEHWGISPWRFKWSAHLCLCKMSLAWCPSTNPASICEKEVQPLQWHCGHINLHALDVQRSLRDCARSSKTWAAWPCSDDMMQYECCEWCDITEVQAGAHCSHCSHLPAELSNRKHQDYKILDIFERDAEHLVSVISISECGAYPK